MINRLQKTILGTSLVLTAMFAPVMTPVANAAAAKCMMPAGTTPTIRLAGTKVTATLTIPEACGTKEVSLATYTAPNKTDGKPYNLQKLYQSTTQNLTPGTHTLTIEAPDCYYQIDLAQGAVLKDFSTTTYRTEKRLITSWHGGTKSCTPVTPVTPTVTPVTPETVTPAATPVVQTTASALPNTGAGNVVGTAAAAAVLATVIHAKRRKLLSLVSR